MSKQYDDLMEHVYSYVDAFNHLAEQASAANDYGNAIEATLQAVKLDIQLSIIKIQAAEKTDADDAVTMTKLSSIGHSN